MNVIIYRLVYSFKTISFVKMFHIYWYNLYVIVGFYFYKISLQFGIFTNEKNCNI